MNDHYEQYLSGERLYGDDFSDAQIAEWFAAEKEGYASLGAKDKKNYRYRYHEFNMYHCFRFLNNNRIFQNALGIGSAYGEEFLPIIDRIQRLTILDPSDSFSSSSVIATPIEYVKPHPSGKMPFSDASFDLATSFGALHHIPNVSYVIGELYRCLREEGVFLLREPIVSMGDWRKPRKGLTTNERGIPLHLLDSIIGLAGFKVLHRALYSYRPFFKFVSKVGLRANSSLAVRLDSIICSCCSKKIKYHRESLIDKFSPSAVAYVLVK